MTSDRWHPLKAISFITAASIALWTAIIGAIGWVAM